MRCYLCNVLINEGCKLIALNQRMIISLFQFIKICLMLLLLPISFSLFFLVLIEKAVLEAVHRILQVVINTLWVLSSLERLYLLADFLLVNLILKFQVLECTIEGLV